jgi:hypothetical protein
LQYSKPWHSSSIDDGHRTRHLAWNLTAMGSFHEANLDPVRTAPGPDGARGTCSFCLA